MIDRQTVFSECRYYRYTLWRTWAADLFGDQIGYVQFIGLNPSTADETKDDPTIRRCTQFAKDWGYDGFCMTNLFAWRHTDPKVMLIATEPVGPDNDKWLVAVAKNAAIVVAAWGNYGGHRDRYKEVMKLIPNLQCIKINEKTGQPSHPLYLPADLRPVPYAATTASSSA